MSNGSGALSIRLTSIIPILFVVTIFLGVWAWHDHHFSYLDALYRAISLFDLGNDLYNGGGIIDWRFQVGRWTGLLTVFGAAAVALTVLLQERITATAARWARQAVVIIGTGSISAKAFEAAKRSGQSVIWIGANAMGSGVLRSIALPWPPEDHAVTISTHALNADYVLITHHDDAEAIVLARTARIAAPNSFITVLMHDTRLAEDIASTVNESRTRILSVAALSARALHQKHPPFLRAKELGHGRIHALIIGFGQTGQAIARDLIVNCRTSYLQIPRITVVDPNASTLANVMRLRAPEIDQCAEFEFVEGLLSTEMTEPSPAALAARLAAGGPLTAAYICIHDDASTLSTAAMLQSLFREVSVRDLSVFVRLREGKMVGGDEEDLRGLETLVPFGDTSEVLAASEFLSARPDAAARNYCEAYRAALPAEQRDDPANRSARPWDELDETFRQASRDAVAHAPAKLASAGIDPALWRGVNGLPRLPAGVLLFHDDAECEVLARLEHERWNAQRRMDGWRRTSAPSKDTVLRLHPDLRPYDELSEQVKEYDRVYIRETQVLCTGK